MPHKMTSKISSLLRPTGLSELDHLPASAQGRFVEAPL